MVGKFTCNTGLLLRLEDSCFSRDLDLNHIFNHLHIYKKKDYLSPAYPAVKEIRSLLMKWVIRTLMFCSSLILRV